MVRSEEIINNYRITDKRVDDEIFYKIEKPDLNIEIVEENPFQEYDSYCDKMNEIKYRTLEKTSLVGMGRVVESTKERPVIGTQALDTCYGILFYEAISISLIIPFRTLLTSLSISSASKLKQ